MSVMDQTDPRAVLDRLIRERGADYAALSRILGKNAAYIQQYIKRGVPRRLSEEDRWAIARHFGISQRLLGGPTDDIPGEQEITYSSAMPSGFTPVRFLDKPGSAADGAEDGQGSAVCCYLPDALMRKISNDAPLSEIVAVSVDGDAMMPLLADGDDLLIDRSDGLDRLRDGVYAIWLGDILAVRRITRDPTGATYKISCDNPAYPAFEHCDSQTLTVIGRCVWRSNRLK